MVVMKIATMFYFTTNIAILHKLWYTYEQGI